MASPPEWPKDTGTPAQGDQSWPGETKILQEPPPPRRKTASTPRPERGGSPTRAEQGPVQAMWSLRPVVRKEKPSASNARVPETEESGSDGSDGSEDKQGWREERHHPVARPTSDQDGDEEGLRPEQEEAMGTEPSADLALAILNGLDISSLPTLRDLSTGASTMVSIQWPLARMEQATPEWRQRASQAMSQAMAKMHNSTVCRVMDGLVAARALGSRQPDDINEILRDIPPRRGVLPIPGPAKGSPRVNEMFPETRE